MMYFKNQHLILRMIGKKFLRMNNFTLRSPQHNGNSIIPVSILSSLFTTLKHVYIIKKNLLYLLKSSIQGGIRCHYYVLWDYEIKKSFALSVSKFRMILMSICSTHIPLHMHIVHFITH